MLFNSLTFAIFLPIVFILYYLVPHKYRWAFLLIASYVFYMNLHAGYGLLLFFTTVLTYLLAKKTGQNPCFRPQEAVSLGRCSASGAHSARL